MNFLVAAALIATSSLIPINDLGTAPYDFGYYGGLWGDGMNAPPADHLAAGLELSSEIVPRDREGNPSDDGAIVFLTIGNFEANSVACSADLTGTCSPDSFVVRAAEDPRFTNRHVAFLNAAIPTTTALGWGVRDTDNYNRIANQILAPRGYTNAQVQVAWLLTSHYESVTQMPAPAADAYSQKVPVSDTLRALRQHYPNLKIVYMSSGPYRGYSTVSQGEPFGYEYGYSTRFMMVAQMEEARMADSRNYWDSRVGDINYRTGMAPYISWGPYYWANGTTPRSDGLTWSRDDFESDGMTLSSTGVHKAAGILLDFLAAEPTARGFLGVTTEPGPKPQQPRRRAAAR